MKVIYCDVCKKPVENPIPARNYFQIADIDVCEDCKNDLDHSLPKTETIHIHCRSGYRAHLALRILKQRGFEKVINVTGGFLAIQAEGGFEIEQPK